jgi:hypothetical protein
LDIISRYSSFSQPAYVKRSELIKLTSLIKINCPILDNNKLWSIYKANENTGADEKPIILINNPTIYYSDLVIQPKTLAYGLYRCVLDVTMNTKNHTSQVSSQIDTYIRIVSSQIVISSLKLSQPMFGGTIEITRSLNETIEFDPYIHSYDIDELVVISTLSFKYACQVLDSNDAMLNDYPILAGSDSIVHLDEIKANDSLKSLDTCFISTGIFLNIYFKLKQNYISTKNSNKMSYNGIGYYNVKKFMISYIFSY